MDKLIDISELSVSYAREKRVEVLSDVNLSIERGEILGLVGESGSGKTTLGMAIPRLLGATGRISSGQVLLEGEDLAQLSEKEMRRIRGKRVAVVFQDPSTSFNPVLTIGEQLAETIRIHRDTGESTSVWTESFRKFSGPLARRGRAWNMGVEMLERVGIPDPAGNAQRYPHQLSGGMRQRAAIAMALCCEPDLLIADEITTALDVTVQATVLDELVDLVRDLDTSVMLITHDLDVASQVCDRIAVMYAGQIFESCLSRETFANPQNPYTRSLLASQPRLDSGSGPLLGLEGGVPNPGEDRPGCRFADRCPEVEPVCHRVAPSLLRLSERLTVHDANHECRCLLREEDPQGALARHGT